MTSANLSWREARAELAAILTGVAITEPIEAEIKRVFETPPAQASDFPCVIILGAAKDVDRHPGTRRREYTVHLRLVVKEADLGRWLDIVDAFEEAITTAFDQNVTLNQKVTTVLGGSWSLPDAATAADVGGQKQRLVDGTVTLMFYDAPYVEE